MDIQTLRKGILVCFCAIFVVLGTLVSYGSFGLDYYIKNEFFFALIILSIIVLTREGGIRFIKNNIIWFLLLIVAILSAIVNDRNQVINLFSMLFFVSVASVFSEDSLKCMIMSSIIGQFVFFAQYRMTSYFNSYALTTALVGLEIMILLFLNQNDKLWRIICVYGLFFVVLFVMASRTALLAFFFAGLIIIIGTFHEMKTNRLVSIFVLAGLVFIVIYKYYDYAYSLLFNKWANFGYTTDISSGRFKIWKDIVVNQRTLLGHSTVFIFDTYGHEDAHNVFVQVLGKYGVVALLFFLFWIIDVIKKITRLTSTYKTIFMGIFAFYLIAGSFENVLFLDCKVFLIAFCFCVNLSWLYKTYDNMQEQFDEMY